MTLLSDWGMGQWLHETSPEVNRDFSADVVLCYESLGRCPRLALNAAPKAFGAKQIRSCFGSKGIGIAIALRRVGPRRTALK